MTSTRTLHLVCFAALLALAAGLYSGCSGSSAGKAETDGDTALFCTSNADCADAGDDCYCQSQQCVCAADGDTDSATDTSCSQDEQCKGFGEDCLCMNEHCYCPALNDGDKPDEDGDGNTDGPKLCVAREVIDMGGVLLGSEGTKELTLSNCGSMGALSITMLRASADTTAAHASSIFDSTEWNLTAVGTDARMPTDGNPVSLDPGESLTILIHYLPARPGEHWAILEIASSTEFVDISLHAPIKSPPLIGITCRGEQFTSTTDPKLTDLIGAYSFGVVPVGALGGAHMICDIQNTAQSDNGVLIISGLQFLSFEEEKPFSSSGFSIDYSTLRYDNPKAYEFWLKPQQILSVPIVFEPRTNGLTAVKLAVTHNDARSTVSNPAIIKLIGIGGVPEIQTVPAGSINFGNVESSTDGHVCKETKITIRNIGQTKLSVNSAKLSEDTPAVFVLNLDYDGDGVNNVPVNLKEPDPLTGEPGPISEISVKCCPRGREGYGGMLRIESNSNYQNPFTTYIPLTCTGVRADCSISPKQLDFGCLRIGQNATQTVTVTNNGAASTQITGVSLLPVIPDFEVMAPSTPFDLLAGDTKEIDVTYTAAGEGIVSTQLVITPLAGSGCVEQSVTLTGCGVEPRILVPSTCLEWPNVQLPPDGITADNFDQWTTTKNIRVRNSGTAPLTIQSVQIPNQIAGKEEFLIEAPEGTSVVIPPGGDWSFAVRYVPQNVGDDSAYVQICSDAANPGSSTFTCQTVGYKATGICLHGSTIDPQLAVLPETLIFRSVLVGESKVSTIRINNKSGNGPVFIKSITLENGNNQIFIPTDTNGQPMITHSEGGGAPSPVTLPFPSGGYQLEGSDELIVAIQYKPTAPPMAMRAQLQIEHSDLDAARLGASPGSSYPKWTVDIFGTSETNTSPVAIAQSPPEDVGDRAGTRQLKVMIGAEISIGATNSYDNDDDPETPVAEDYITAYDWAIIGGDASGIRFTGTGDTANHSTSQVTSVRFDVAGTYTLQLRVKDSRNTWSDTNTIDSKLVITAIELPTAIVRQCVTQNTAISTKSGVDICFDGCNSTAVAGSGLVTDYRWDVQKEGGSYVNFSNGNCSAHYTFQTAGRYSVRLKVKDENDNWSAPASIPVTVYYDQSLKIEMNWSGGGDVDLHYIRPGGSYDDTSDCNAGNQAPNWVRYGYGNPVLTPSGDGGLSPEVLNHNNPGDGTYTLTIKYKTPSQACGYENHFVKDGYREDCDHCGCNTGNLGCTLLFGCAVQWGSCCKTCDINEMVYVCHPIPAVVNLRIYAGGAINPTCTKTGINMADDKVTTSYTLLRKNGEWICP